MAVLRKRGLIYFSLICLIAFLFSYIQPAFANVEEVQSEQQQITKTEASDGSNSDVDAGGGDIPWYKQLWNHIRDFGERAIETGRIIIEDLKTDWDHFTDWVADSWIADVWENEWVQTIVAGIVATAVIVVGVIVIVGTAPAWGTIAIIGGLALGGGFLYQWLAGDNYSFWGALGFSALGGLLGYFGATTGAFATSWGWLKGTAFPAAVNWARNIAMPWVARQGKAAWGWLGRQGKSAWGWLSRQGKSAWGWLSRQGKSAWGWLSRQGKTAWGWLKSGPVRSFMWNGFKLGAVSGAFGSVVSTALSDEPFVFVDFLKDLALDTFVGGFSGAILGPIVGPGQSLSWPIIGGLGIYGGLENMVVDKIKEGDWSLESFFLGLGITAISTKVIGDVVGLVMSKFNVNSDYVNGPLTKGTEEAIKWGYNEIKEMITGEESNSNSPNNKAENKTTPNQNTNDPQPEVPTNEGTAPQPEVPTNEGTAPQPEAPTNEGTAPQPEAPANEGTAPQPEAPANEGTAPQPEAPANEGTAPQPEVPTNEGTAPQPEAPTNEGTGPQPEAPANEGTAPQLEVPTNEGTAPQPEVPTNEGTAPQPEVPANEGTAPQPEAPANEGTDLQPEAPANEGTDLQPEAPINEGTDPQLEVPTNEGIAPQPEVPTNHENQTTNNNNQTTQKRVSGSIPVQAVN